jgi:hypothetical protein
MNPNSSHIPHVSVSFFSKTAVTVLIDMIRCFLAATMTGEGAGLGRLDLDISHPRSDAVPFYGDPEKMA